MTLDEARAKYIGRMTLPHKYDPADSRYDILGQSGEINDIITEGVKLWARVMLLDEHGYIFSWYMPLDSILLVEELEEA